jgi:hypothetical protein
MKRRRITVVEAFCWTGTSSFVLRFGSGKVGAYPSDRLFSKIDRRQFVEKRGIGQVLWSATTDLMDPIAPDQPKLIRDKLIPALSDGRLLASDPPYQGFLKGDGEPGSASFCVGFDYRKMGPFLDAVAQALMEIVNAMGVTVRDIRSFSRDWVLEDNLFLDSALLLARKHGVEVK